MVVRLRAAGSLSFILKLGRLAGEAAASASRRLGVSERRGEDDCEEARDN